MRKNKEVEGNVKVFNKAIDFDNLPEVDLISKFIVHDATDEIIIGGFGNLEGNLGLLKYNFEEIRKMIKENNNDNDNIRLINSLLGSLKELHQENQKLKQQNEFLMKQDNILQTLIQWLYKEQERYRKTLSEKPTNDKDYINVQVTSVALEQIKVVIDKIIELKEEMK